MLSRKVKCMMIFLCYGDGNGRRYNLHRPLVSSELVERSCIQCFCFSFCHQNFIKLHLSLTYTLFKLKIPNLDLLFKEVLYPNQKLACFLKNSTPFWKIICASYIVNCPRNSKMALNFLGANRFLSYGSNSQNVVGINKSRTTWPT